MNEALELISVNFWHIIVAIANLLILTLIVRKFLFKPVQKILAERQAEVDNLYQQAEESAASAENDKQMYHEKLEKAEHEVEEIIKSATVRAERLGDEIVAEANAKADAAIKKADADIAQSKKKAINEIKNDIAGISVSIAEKVVEREINEKDHNDIIESFIDQL